MYSSVLLQVTGLFFLVGWYFVVDVCIHIFHWLFHLFICICVPVCAHKYKCSQRPEERTRSPRTRIAGGYELPVVGSGN